MFYLCKLKQKWGKIADHPLIKTMKDRIRQIMESKHMTQQVFAQFIEMSPASLSSIFNNRNRPTLNVVEAIKRKIPDINTDWLMFGVGSMYTSSAAAASPSSKSATAVESHIPQESVLDFSDTPSPTPAAEVPVLTDNRPSATIQANGVRNTRINSPREDIKIIDKPLRRVTEIRVFYDDQTWESFIPAKK